MNGGSARRSSSYSESESISRFKCGELVHGSDIVAFRSAKVRSAVDDFIPNDVVRNHNERAHFRGAKGDYARTASHLHGSNAAS